MGKLIYDEMIQRNIVQHWLPCHEPYQTKNTFQTIGRPLFIDSLHSSVWNILSIIPK